MSPRSSASLSEGEVSSGAEEKAIRTTTSRAADGRVNKSARLPPGSSSRLPPLHGLSNDLYYHFRDDDGPAKGRHGGSRDRSRSRSPYRANKPGRSEKRRHEDDHYNHKSGSDPRRFKVHYEGGRSDSRRSNVDDERSRYSRSRSREPYRASRDTDRSRSPYRRSRNNDSKYSNGERTTQGEADGQVAGTEARQQQGNSNVKVSLTQNAKTNEASDEAGSGQSEAPNALSEAEIIEQRRKRREAIRNRHKGDPSLLAQALLNNRSAPPTPIHESSGGASERQSPPSSLHSPRTPAEEFTPGSPAEFTVTNDEELAVDRNDVESSVDDGPSAADYDANADMQEDRPEFKKQEQLAAAVNETAPVVAEQEQPSAPKPSKEFDMFADDDEDDMFAPADTAQSMATVTTQAKALDQSLLDNWDYPDGHYRIILGELLDGRYAIQQQIGKGTFATVVRAQDTRTGNSVAVKIACNNETMYKAGQKEMDMLHLLNQNDTEDKKHIIRLLRNFDHKGHMCLVFENLSADLREVLKKFGRNVGLNLKAIRSYAQQMFLALSHLKKCSILHADIKPDNILVSEKRNLLKICDLGTAAFADDAEVTPYLVSRFYRAPEVILGMPFDYAIDMWSIGCTLYELYTGRILFAGADNNQMLRAIQECRGKFPIRMLKRSTLAEKHFDFDGNFFSQERDKITGKATLRQMNFNKTTPGKDLKARMSANTKGMRAEEVKEHATFLDLMDKCLQLDPARRISPNDALRHAFVSHTMAGQADKEKKQQVKVAMNVPGRVK